MKMKVLQTVQKNFVILGIQSNQSRFNGKYMRTSLIYGVGLISSALFLIRDANSFQEYTDNLYITTSLTVGFFTFTNIVLKLNDFFELIDNIEKTFDKKSENAPASKAIYKHTNRFVEKVSQILRFAVVILTPVCMIFPKAIVSYFTYYSTDLGNKAFELPLLFWFPFDWQNPIGYFVAVILQYITMACNFRVVACGVSFGVGNVFFALSAINDIKNDLNIIHESGKIPGSRLQTLKRISEFVKFHSFVKRYMKQFLAIYQPIFMVAYVWSLVTICGVMLLVQMQIQGNSSLALVLVTIFYVLYAFGVVLLICELGQRLTDAFGDVGSFIEEFEWNLFSLELQKILPIILFAAQQPVEFSMFGSTSAHRETFKKVVNNAYTYFSIIRQFLK